MALHVPARCSVRGCHYDARRWFDAELLFGRTYRPATFYVCDEHAECFSPDDETVYWFDLETGFIRTVELAVYACAEDCRICNY